MSPASSAPSVDQAALRAAVPQGTVAGGFSIIDHDKLASATNSKKAGPFVNVGQQEYEYPINQGKLNLQQQGDGAEFRTAMVPLPEPRKSRNELRELAKNDPQLLG